MSSVDDPFIEKTKRNEYSSQNDDVFCKTTMAKEEFYEENKTHEFPSSFFQSFAII